MSFCFIHCFIEFVNINTCTLNEQLYIQTEFAINMDDCTQTIHKLTFLVVWEENSPSLIPQHIIILIVTHIFTK